MDLAFGRDGDLLVLSPDTKQLLSYDGATGAFSGVFATGPELVQSKGISVGPNGDVFVSSLKTHSILRYDGVSGRFMGNFVYNRSGGLALPFGMAFTPDVLRGGTTGLARVTRVSCENLRSGQRVVTVPAVGETSWDCQAAGLVAQTGDEVVMKIFGTADSKADTGLGGGSMGYSELNRIDCLNRSSGQRLYDVSLGPERSRWDCEAPGLIANAGDKIVMNIRGRVD